MADTDSKTSHPYQNASLSTAERVNDLLGRMTLEEKAGQLFHTMIFIGPDGGLAEGKPDFGLLGTQQMLNEQYMTHFNVVGPMTDPTLTARWHNRVQEAAARTRLGIPVTISTDPRHHFTENVGTSFLAGCFSQWPETLGFAALRSPELVEQFAGIARREYVALGIRASLHPQIDLATEPRWARINATFGEDAELSGELVAAYIRGFQGSDGQQSVSCMTKHFPGGGPQKDGEDPHFHYGKDQVYPSGNFDYHLKPFYPAIAAGTRQIMPYYGRPVGLELDINGCGQKEKIEEVGFAFNKQLITDLLRAKMGYKGIICTDWGLLNDAMIMGQDMPARAWGCEDLKPLERAVKILNAGCDQFGGEACPHLIIEAVKKDLITEERLDQSVRRLLEEKFWLGLFDDKRYVDIDHAANDVGLSKDIEAGKDAQRRSFTLLKNNGILPLQDEKLAEMKLFVEGIDSNILTTRIPSLQVVEKPEQATLAILRLKAPYEDRKGGFESYFHAGTLEYSQEEKARQQQIYEAVPTIVDIYLDRPAIIPEIVDKASAVLANYGASIECFIDILRGKTMDGNACSPQGKLPFDLPSSTANVEASSEDAPFDTRDSLFKYGHGLHYG